MAGPREHFERTAAGDVTQGSLERAERRSEVQLGLARHEVVPGDRAVSGEFLPLGT